MGTRLYPTDFDEYLNSRFGEETVKKADAFEKWVKNASLEELNEAFQVKYDDKDYLIFSVRQRIEMYQQIHYFGLFGWGKPNEDAWEILESEGMNPDIGSTENPEIVKRLLDAMGISTSVKVSGLCWN